MSEEDKVTKKDIKGWSGSNNTGVAIGLGLLAVAQSINRLTNSIVFTRLTSTSNPETEEEQKEEPCWDDYSGDSSIFCLPSDRTNVIATITYQEDTGVWIWRVRGSCEMPGSTGRENTKGEAKRAAERLLKDMG